MPNEPRPWSAREIVAWREARGWSRADLAAWLGLSVRAVADWECGRRTAPGPVVRALEGARAAECPEDGNGATTGEATALEALVEAGRRTGKWDRVIEAVRAGAACEERERDVLWWATALRLARGAGRAVRVPAGLRRDVEAFWARPGESRAAHRERLWRHPAAWGARRALWAERERRWRGVPGERARRIAEGVRRERNHMEARAKMRLEED